MADLDSAGGQHLLDHLRAQGEPEVQPDSMADHFSREAVAGVARMAGRFHSSRMPASRHLRVKLTVPLLFPDVLAPVCAQQLIDVNGPLMSIGDLARYRLIHVTTRRYAWHDWLRANGSSLVPDRDALYFGHFFMAMGGGHGSGAFW